MESSVCLLITHLTILYKIVASCVEISLGKLITVAALQNWKENTGPNVYFQFCDVATVRIIHKEIVTFCYRQAMAVEFY